jgi:hypothetical protein
MPLEGCGKSSGHSIFLSMARDGLFLEPLVEIDASEAPTHTDLGSTWLQTSKSARTMFEPYRDLDKKR